jgi:purine nucleoside permease
MKISKSALLWSFSIISLASSFPWNPIAAPALEKKWSQPSPICPKFVIISMFVPEEDVWYGPGLAFDVLAHNITVPGLSPTYPDVHCTDDWDICQVTVGEGKEARIDI